MSKRKKMIVLLLLGSLGGLGYWLYRAYQPPAERQQIQFVDSSKAVEDSMRALRRICEAVDPHQFMGCSVHPWDNIMYFRMEKVGRFDTLTVSNPAFSDMKQGDVRRLLSLLSFLNRNFISGVFHERMIDSWFYPYRENVHYADWWGIRNLYIWDNPQYPINPANILDRKGKLTLLANKKGK